MTVTKAELEARDIVDDWIGEENIQFSPQDRRYWRLMEKIQGVVKERDLMEKHANEGWKLANTRTTERQEILGALKNLLEVMGRAPVIGPISLGAARDAAEAVVKKFKPLLED